MSSFADKMKKLAASPPPAKPTAKSAETAAAQQSPLLAKFSLGRMRDLEAAERRAEKVEKAEAQILHASGNQTQFKSALARFAENKAAAENAFRSDKILQLDVPRAGSIQLDPSQEIALAGMLQEKYAICIGPAGSGKSTVSDEFVHRIKGELQLFDRRTARANSPDETEADEPDWGIPIAFCAFMGTSADNLRLKLSQEFRSNCSTIHSLLGFAPVWYSEEDPATGELKSTMRFEPSFGAWRKLPYKVIIIDEGQTVPGDLWDQLIDACPDDCRIYVFGDIQQLPPVMERSFLGFAMLKWPTFELTTIHRQKMPDGTEGVHPIIAASQAILRGQLPQRVPGVFDMVVVPNDIGSGTLPDYLYNGITQLHKKGEFAEMQDALIVPTNIGPIGQTALNEKFVIYFNPPKKDEATGAVLNRRQFIKTGKESLAMAIGDKIMLLENDRSRGLTNGMIGVVVDVLINPDYKAERIGMSAGALENIGAIDEGEANDMFGSFNITDFSLAPTEEKKEAEAEVNQRPASHILVVQFQSGISGEPTEVRFATTGQYKKIVHAYAFTCHKSLGREYPTAVILCHSVADRMLSVEWLYTAVTRGKSRVILICNMAGLNKALRTRKIKGKTLAEKIKTFFDLTTKPDTRQPNLPNARKL